MRNRRLGFTLFLLVLLVPSLLAADVGFKLPRNALSRANTAKGYRLRLEVRPWGPDGNTVQPDFANLAALRYGGSLVAGGSAPDVAGLHVTDYEAALVMIAAKDPEWCRQAGGQPCHPGQPTQEESHDAQYWSFGNRVIERARELGLAEAGPTGPSVPIHLAGPDSGKANVPLAYAATGCNPLRWRWTAPDAFIRGRGESVIITFPKDGVYTVTAGGTGGNCADASMTVTIGDVKTLPPDTGDAGGSTDTGTDTDTSTDTSTDSSTDTGTTGAPLPACDEVLKELEPLLRQMLQVIESGREGTPPEPVTPETPPVNPG